MSFQKLYGKWTPEERREFAAKVGVSEGYLYQIATRYTGGREKGRRPSLDLMQRMAEACPKLKASALLKEFAE